jgi:hypothetical protein
MRSVLVTRQLPEQLGGFDPERGACEGYDLYLRLAGLSAIQGVRETLVPVRSRGERYHNACIVYAGRAGALAKLLASSTDRSQQSLRDARVYPEWWLRGAVAVERGVAPPGLFAWRGLAVVGATDE